MGKKDDGGRTRDWHTGNGSELNKQWPSGRHEENEEAVEEEEEEEGGGRAATITTTTTTRNCPSYLGWQKFSGNYGLKAPFFLLQLTHTLTHTAAYLSTFTVCVCVY